MSSLLDFISSLRRRLGAGERWSASFEAGLAEVREPAVRDGLARLYARVLEGRREPLPHGELGVPRAVALLLDEAQAGVLGPAGLELAERYLQAQVAGSRTGFVQGLGCLLAGGVQIFAALDAHAAGTADPALQRILTRAAEAIQTGQSMATAFEEAGERAWADVVRLGEADGRLADRLMALT